MGLRVETLGGFRASVAGQSLAEDAWERRKARQLFKCLLSRPRHRVAKDRLVEWLWPDSDPEAAASTLRSTVHALRSTLREAGLAGVDSILVDHDTVGLGVTSDVWVDADEVERLLATARTSADSLLLLEQADILYAGEYLPDDLYEDWATERRAALKRAWAELQAALSHHRERGGDVDGAVAARQRLLDADPGDERAGQELLRLLVRHGRRSAASRVYRRLIQVLRDDLGVEPSDETTAIGHGLTSRSTDTSPTGGTKPLTFLLTDIEGSVPLWERDAGAMRRALARHDALVDECVARYGGTVVRVHGEGDSRFATFAGPDDAVAAAFDLQRALLREAWTTPTPLRARMALHTGEAIKQDGHYYGSAVNRCARLRALAHGGQVLMSEASAGLIRGSLPSGAHLLDLGEHQLRGFDLPERVFQLCHPELPVESPPLATSAAPRHSLPTEPTPLIGREREVAQVKAMLLRDDIRLVTLTGPGGSGKTRLGLRVAAELLDQVWDGVYFVPLAPINDPGLVASSIAQALGVREVDDRSILAPLKDYLQAKRVLLLLDNFEHLLPAASLIADLLATSRGLKTLVTSRAALHLRGERELQVPPLALPDPEHVPRTEELAQYPAVTLFLDRARDVRTDFNLTDENGPAVAAVCHRLDGLPLAIELAAARIRLLQPQAMLVRLEHRLSLLTGGALDLPARQRTLRDTIAWSFDLLTLDEQTIFQELAVFVGGCTLQAAEAVCSASDDPDASVLDQIDSLVDKSLLWQPPASGGESRLGMLETIREYALERLETGGRATAARRRHAMYYLALAEGAEREVLGPRQAWWLERLEREHDNLRAAFDWLLASREAEIGLRLSASLSRFWFVRGHISEGRERLARMLTNVGGHDLGRVRAKVLHGLGSLAQRQGHYSAARSPYEEALEIYRALGDAPGLAESLNKLGALAHDEGDYALSRTLHEESLALRRALSDQLGIAASLHNLGTLAHRQGDRAAARALYEEALAIWRTRSASLAIASAVTNLGRLAQDERDYGAARNLYEEGLVIRQQLGDKLGILASLSRIVFLLVEASDDVDHRAGRGRAARLLGAIETLQDALQRPALPTSEISMESAVAQLHGALGEETFGAARAEGQAMTLEQAVAYALEGSPSSCAWTNGR